MRRALTPDAATERFELFVVVLDGSCVLGGTRFELADTRAPRGPLARSAGESRLGVLFRAFGEGAGRKDAPEEPEEVALPGDPDVAREDAEERSSVEEKDGEASRDRPEASLEEAPHEQVPEVAEYEDARPDVYRKRRSDEPRSEASDERSGRTHVEQVTLPPEHDEPAQHHERQRVADEVREASVEKRREEDAHEAGEGAGVDSEPREPSLEHERIDDLYEPHERHEPEEHDAVRLQLLDELGLWPRFLGRHPRSLSLVGARREETNFTTRGDEELPCQQGSFRTENRPCKDALSRQRERWIAAENGAWAPARIVLLSRVP